MQTAEVNPVSELRRLLSRPPSTLLKASAPDLCAALPLLVKFFDRYEALERAFLANNHPHVLEVPQ